MYTLNNRRYKMSRTKRKRKAKQKLKIIRKRKAGKLVRFVLTNSGRKYSGWSNSAYKNWKVKEVKHSQ